jgi:hypothetical protein
MSQVIKYSQYGTLHINLPNNLQGDVRLGTIKEKSLLSDFYPGNPKETRYFFSTKKKRTFNLLYLYCYGLFRNGPAFIRQ